MSRGCGAGDMSGAVLKEGFLVKSPPLESRLSVRMFACLRACVCPGL